MADEEKQANGENEQDSELANLPFPHSRVRDIIRSKQKEGVLIKKMAAIELNLWLGKMAEKVSEEVAKSNRAYVSADDIRKITRKFESVELIISEKKRINAHIDAIKQDLNRLQEDLDRV